MINAVEEFRQVNIDSDGVTRFNVRELTPP